SEGERQSLAIALVALRLERPGWSDWCRRLARRPAARTMYDELLRLRQCERGEHDCGLHPGRTHAEASTHAREDPRPEPDTAAGGGRRDGREELAAHADGAARGDLEG